VMMGFMLGLEFDDVTTGATLKSPLHSNAHYPDNDELHPCEPMKEHSQLVPQ
jgi:hypothetical protein